jgi:hypothetical protein
VPTTSFGRWSRPPSCGPLVAQTSHKPLA